ncbi:hypothetical protein Hanom_Chr12g01123261 [Helianthus anomalus]
MFIYKHISVLFDSFKHSINICCFLLIANSYFAKWLIELSKTTHLCNLCIIMKR